MLHATSWKLNKATITELCFISKIVSGNYSNSWSSLKLTNCVCWVGYRCVFILFVTVLYFTVCLCFLRFYNSMMEQFNLIHIIHNWSFWKAYYHWLIDHWYMTNNKIDLEEDETVYSCSMYSVEVQWDRVFNLRGFLEEPSFYNTTMLNLFSMSSLFTIQTFINY